MGSLKTWSTPYRTWQLIVTYSETQKKVTENLEGKKEIYLCAQEVKGRGEQGRLPEERSHLLCTQYVSGTILGVFHLSSYF